MRRYPQRTLQRSRYHRRGAEPAAPEPQFSLPEPLLALPPGAPIEGPAPVAARWSRRRRLVVFGIPIVVLALLVAIVVSTFLRVRTAYGEIFVTPMPRLQIGQNAAGTPVVVSGSSANSGTPVASPDTNISLPADQIGSPSPNPLDALPNWNQKDRVNILLIGVDSSPARRAAGEFPLSDTMIVVSVNPATKTVGMLSIPRDLLVTIPNYGPDKINAAFADGEVSGLTGPALLRATIEYNFKIPINYYAEVDLVGFQEIIDTLGGVTIDVPAPLKDDQYPGMNYDYTRIIFHTGLQHMNGLQAEEYARSRHDDSDFGRAARQQQVLQAVRSQAVSLGLIPKAPLLIDQLGGTFKTDLSPSQVLALAKLAAGMSSQNIKSYNLLDATTVQWLPGQPYYLIPEWPKIQQLLNDMASR